MTFLYESGVGVYKTRKTALKITQNRKPHTKPSKTNIYTAQFSQNPSLDLKRWLFVEKDIIILDVDIITVSPFIYGCYVVVVKQEYLA